MTQVQNQTLMQAVEIHECPICLEVIEGFKNRVTTECGHTFHCKCLMTNAAHNGFGCPFCRTEMADEVKEEEDNDERYDDDSDDDEDASRASDYDEEDDDLEGELEFIEGEIKQMKLDHVLRGFRWLFQPLNEDDDEDVLEEEVAEDLDDVTVWETDYEYDNEDISASEVDNE